MKTICPHCDQEFDVEENFINIELSCPVCSKNFFSFPAIICPSCQTANHPKNRICHHCYAEVSSKYAENSSYVKKIFSGKVIFRCVLFFLIALIPSCIILHITHLNNESNKQKRIWEEKRKREIERKIELERKIERNRKALQITTPPASEKESSEFPKDIQQEKIKKDPERISE